METKSKKIAFCITCMNRLNHLQQTLEKNIQDNYLPDEVEFVLLDYNSQDGLEEWVRQNMQQHINSGILVYYKTFEPAHYLRSHSRNMAFRLANAKIVCNLDADNFLGEGFALFMIAEFEKNESIFYTSNCLNRDIYGRVCVKKEDFTKIKGYNEALQGYGIEDVDLFVRLEQKGLVHKQFNDSNFYHCLRHSNEERVKEELLAKNTEKIYICYINPYTSGILFLHKDFTFLQYTLIDNRQLNLYAGFTESDDIYFNEKREIVLGKDFQKGTWEKNNDKITLVRDNHTAIFSDEEISFLYQNRTCYAIQDKELQNEIIMLSTTVINYRQVQQQRKQQQCVNQQGFGKGSVFKNFQTNKAIVLS